jgi:hypothetical protein
MGLNHQQDSQGIARTFIFEKSLPNYLEINVILD